jgi:transposase-like protein
MACDAFANIRIAAEVGVAPMTVKAWRDWFFDGGLKDFSAVRPGRGRKPSIAAHKVEEIVRLTLHETPPGQTH